ncbi:MAG TPA: thermosome subunit alpha [Candidatus Pacearchaeota archaeon]|nr:thermosome subunit alpha [Candidatus Pacearchaeota archaeon]
MTDKPVFLMPEDIQRMIGKDAQRNNIQAAKMVAEVVKTTLGPKGMDKMLVSPTDDIIVTNDGVTILEEMEIEHPVARMMVEIARTQENEIGDGTTTAVMIAGKLLENAEKLLDRKIHPTMITKGYHLAAEKSKEILNELAYQVSQENEDILMKVAMTAMTGKGAEDSRERFAEIIVRAVKQIQDKGNIDLKNIKIEKIKSEGVGDTELISGIAFEKERISQDMPQIVTDAKIALVGFPLEIKNTEVEAKISVSSPEQLRNFLDQEERTIREMVHKIQLVGANVVFCQKGIDDFVQYLLSKAGIYACRRVSKDDMEKIAKATGGRIVNGLNELNVEELGKAELVEEVKHGETVLTYVRGCENPKSLTILIHGGTSHVIDEIERAIKDGLGDVVCCLKSESVVAGGGAVEIELARRLRKFGQTLSGREQLAVEEFASALEFIPVTLAENAGLDPIDVLTELKSLHDSGEKNKGLNLIVNKIEDTLEAGIIEPARIKTQAIDSASEVAIMILRIDDVIASSKKPKGKIEFDNNLEY